jgi:tRNA-2-methylthio-N6-dimethylallyladenosine synthase
MVRRYTRAEYLERINLLRETVPGLSVSTDIIVGFPGETEQDFQATLSAVREVGFIGVFGFKYSPRPYTPALKLGDDVSEEEKSRRLAALFELSEGLRRDHLQTLVGGVEQVLIEGRSKGGAFTGRTLRNEIVHLDCTDDPTGEVVDVRIDQAFKHSLAATLLDAKRAKPLVRVVRNGPAPPQRDPRVLPVVG